MVRTKPDRHTPSLLDQPEVRAARVATVALVNPAIDKPYSYYVPPGLADAVVPGARVTVPFGRKDRPMTAVCLSLSEQPWSSTLKPVLSAIDERTLLNEKLLELGQWIARYYAAPLGRTLDLMVPAAAKEHAGWKKVKYATLTRADDSTSRGLQSARSDDGEAAFAGSKLAPKQAAVLIALRAARRALPIADLCSAAACTPAVVAALQRKGLIHIETRIEPVRPATGGVERHEPNFELNADQRHAINEIATAVAARRFSVQVLFGVTGSGKTECYIAAMRQALSEGRQAILLVPEIALTTQTVQRLQARFDRVATIHSGLSGVERSRAWAAIAAGEIPVVIGTRSAVFAPCPDLGVIIVDEEAEGSYKNLAAPRYHTRDAAVKRAHLENIPVVLGSAAPSLETWRNVLERKHYHVLRLPQRVRGLALPTVHLVDMRLEHQARRGVHLLSRDMEAHLARTLERGEQAVLLLNRRGYASFLHCPRCQTVVTCPHCSVHMVFHKTTDLAHCHYCGTRLAVPNRCQMAGCGGNLVFFGIGTQRVEGEIREKFPQARLHRMDSDVMERTEDYARVLGAFERREFDILVGTQMIAKGLDFPFVSFVGVISADTALALDDFRSEERTFQLVLQVAGRSGRGDVGGHVVVQTFAGDTTPIRHAVRGDYEAFAKQELANRRREGLPPYTRMVRIILSDPRMTKLQAAAADLARRIEELLLKRGIKAKLLGPQAARIPRLRDVHRYDIVLIFPAATALLAAMDLFKSESTLRVAARNVVVDVDPVSLQ
jgi:primosomal protein N' (replication factor Y)